MTTIGDARCSWTRIVKPVVAAAVLVWTVAAGAAVAHAQSSDATDEAPPPPGDALPEPPTTVKGATSAAAPDPPPHSAPAPQRTYHCPIDGEAAVPKGTDGKETPRRYSDLEMPTQAYTNLVVVCPKCGYAAWRDDFERAPSDAVTHYAQTVLARSARRADTDPVAAYQHLMNVLHVRRADLHDQVGAALFYSYVLKRKRPYGGLDVKLERKIVSARQRVLKLLQSAMKSAPPRQLRARLEWTYLAGELRRLIGDAKGAASELKLVCEAKREAGYTVGRLGCEMADRASRGDTWEDYRDGVFDVRGIDAAERDNERRRAESTKRASDVTAAKAAKVAAAEAAAAEEKKRRESKPEPSEHSDDRSKAALETPATPSDDPYAPPPPPVAR